MIDTRQEHSFALALPQIVLAPIPLLSAGHEQSVRLSQHQIVCLLANAFLCTSPWTQWRGAGTYPRINFTHLFGCDRPDNAEKIACIVHYFSVIANRREDELQQTVLFQRRVGARRLCLRYCSSFISLRVRKNTALARAAPALLRRACRSRRATHPCPPSAAHRG